MATDYDQPRHTDEGDELPEHAVQALKQTRAAVSAELGDDTDHVEVGLDLPDADLTGEELTVPVIPPQADEFTCSSCYLVHHRNQVAPGHTAVCIDCAN